ncbi:hypothetical protein C1645_774615 [Glomus cerebriforme]|uniref:Uncharacterized protein n=1 Tax=Glomus cerebriforme TaxID=658196 RepID=A0A397SRH2_9GLOM|nr:hypothetical protein C1645_774615 [Glomus cerebriforme]
MWIISTIVKFFKLSYNIFTHLIITINRYVAFLMHLIMMFFVWNSLLIVIGIVQTIQLSVGFGRDVSNLTTTSSKNSEPDKNSLKEEKEEKPPTYWQKRRKTFQEFVDNLYINYMERLIEIQQGQAKYWQFDNSYIYPQSRYYYYDNVCYDNIEDIEGQETVQDNVEDDHGETSSDASGGSGDNNHFFIPPIKITEDTSNTTF